MPGHGPRSPPRVAKAALALWELERRLLRCLRALVRSILPFNIKIIKLFLSKGIYTGDREESGQQLFLVQRKAFSDLCEGLTQPCSCVGHSTWVLESFQQVSVTLFYADIYKQTILCIVLSFFRKGMLLGSAFAVISVRKRPAPGLVHECLAVTTS